MFITDLSEEVNAQAGAGVDGLKSWKRLDTSDPWFQITVTRGMSPNEEQSVIFLSEPLELQPLVHRIQCCNDVCINDIAVSTPGDVNGSGQWRLDKLLEVMVCFDLDTAETHIQYRTDAGLYGELPSRSSIKGIVKKTVFLAAGLPMNLFDPARYSFLYD